MKNEFKNQLNLLKNNLFNVLLKDRKRQDKELGRLYNINGNKILNKTQILELYNSFKAFNSKNNDIYLMPVDAPENEFYNITIDDLTWEKAKILIKSIKVDYLLFSSKNNYQAMINLSKSLYDKTQADFLSKYINLKLGDPHALGSRRFFRSAGFKNKKAKNNNELAYLVNIEENFQETADVETSLRNIKKILNVMPTEKEKSEVLNIVPEKLTQEEEELYRREVLAELGLCKKLFPNLDFSAVDFRIVKRLNNKGATPNKIASALLKFANVESRHLSTEDYLKRTISKALAKKA